MLRSFSSRRRNKSDRIKGRSSPQASRPRHRLLLESLESRLAPASLQAYDQLPLAFEANQGQTSAQVDFLSRGNGYALFLTPSEAVLALHKPVSGSPTAQPGPEDVLSMNFVGANTAPQVVGLDQQAGVSNYFLSNDPSAWRPNVSHYGRVQYRNLYPGIDLVYYGNQTQLEYDFVVAPGASPGTIHLAFQGAQGMSLDNQGNLVLHTAGGDVVEHAPIVYQQSGGVRHSISGAYVLEANGQVGFKVGGYDPSQALIIDPVLSYSTYLGGSGGDQGTAIAVDSSGNVYITGQTISTNFPTTAGAFQTQIGANPSTGDAFVAKVNASGTALIYSTYLGGSSSDIGRGIVLDASGNVYVTGETSSRDFPVVNGTAHGNFDFGSVFVTKLNPSGTALVYSTCLGGSAVSNGEGIALDSSGNVYIAGGSFGSFPTTANALQPTFGGVIDAIIAKLSPSGALTYSTYLGGTGSDDATGVALDASGNVYVTGATSGGFPTTIGAFQTTFGGGPFDAFVAKLNASGTALVYSTYLGGSDVDRGQGIVLDSGGNAYVTGYTFSSNFPTTPGAFQTTGNANAHAFVTKLNATGSALVYSTYLGGNANELSFAIAVDSAGEAYVTGQTTSTNFPTTAGAFQTTYGGGKGNAFVTKFNATGSALVYSTYLGGNSGTTYLGAGDQGTGIVLDSAGNAYVTGSAGSSNFPITAGAFQTTYGGNGNAFIAKFLLGRSVSAVEGTQFSGVVASVVDPDPPAPLSAWSATINWGDGTPATAGTISQPGGAGTNLVVKGSHTYAEEASYSYTVQLQENPPVPPSPPPVTVSGTATVADAPVLFNSNATLSSVESQSVGGLLGTFTDANTLATPSDHTINIDWGDGTTSTGTVVPHGGGSVTGLAVGPNVNLSKEPGNQNENSLAINPTNPNNIVAWSNDENAPNGGVDEYRSVDGGNTWTRKIIGANDGLEIFGCCDTQSVFDSFGNLFAVNIDFTGGFADAIKVLESFDGGNTFQVVTIQSDPNGGLDQPSIAFGDGMVWVSYKDNSGSAIKAAGAAVTGLGKVGPFSTPEAAPGSSAGSFGNTAVSPNGQVMVTYQSPVSSAGPSTIFVNVDPDGLGPQGFGPAITVSNTNVGGFDPIPPQPFRTIDSEANTYYDNSGGPHNGRAYLVYTDAPTLGSSATDIFVRISDNNGTTWTKPIRITDDTSGNSHFNPQMAIDPTTGNVAVAWYDCRNAGSNDVNTQIFATLSSDGGTTWLPNVQVSTGTSNILPSNSGIDYGDYMLMDFYNGTFRPIWSDNSNSTGDNPDGTLTTLDIYSAPVTLTQGIAFDVMGSHTYTEEGNFSIKVQVVDDGGSSATTTSTAHIVDAPLAAAPPVSTTATEQTSFTGRVASFTDNDANGTATDYTAMITWATGQISAGTITANASGGFDVTGTNTFGEEGTYSISVRIQDMGGSSATVKGTVTVGDAPLTPTGLNLSTLEGTSISGQMASFQDAASKAPLTDFTTGGGGATINWGDGSKPTIGVVTQPGGVGTPFVVSGGSHLYTDAGSFTVTVTLTDKGGSTATATTTVTVNDAPLSAIGIALQMVEGAPFTGQVAGFIDANPLATLASFTTGSGKVTIDWGDGSPITTATVTQPNGRGTAFVVSGSHTYLDEQSYTIHVVVNDRGGSTAQSLASALVLDAGLTASGVTVNALDGVIFSGTVATFVDANPNAPLSDFPYVRIDWGDNFATLGTVTQPGGRGTPFVISGNHAYSKVGSYSIQVSIYDVGGSRATASSMAFVGDAPLTLSTGPLTMTEAATFSGSVGTFVDADTSAPLTDFTTGTGGATIDWGDGSTPTSATITQPNGTGTPFVISGSHLYQEDGTYSVKVSVQDAGGPQAQSSFTATVMDAALTATGAPAKQFDGFTYTGTLATVTDTNAAAPLTDFTTGTGGASIDWGDGSATSAGSVTQPGGPGTAFVVQGTHTYAKIGAYLIKVTVQDLGGSVATASTSLSLVHFDDLIGRNAQTGQWTVAVSNGSSAFSLIPYGTWDPSKTWVNVQLGDFNRDGRPDMVGRDAASGDWWVSLSNGTSFTTSKWGSWSPAVTWVDVQVGDFNGDGKTDIVGRWAQAGQWWMAQSTGSSFVNSLWATWSPAVTWVDVKVGDFNGDGKADLTGRWLQGGSWWTAVSTGSSFVTSQWASWSPNVTWVDVNVGDFNGDGKADLVGRYLEAGQWWAAISNGSSFTNSLWATWSTSVTWTDVKVGDFNGDGKTDIIGRAMLYNSWWAGLSTGSSFQTMFWTSWSAASTWTNVQVGDFNGDGKTDLAGFAQESGAWWTSLSTGTSGVTSLWAVSPTAWVDVHTADFA